MLVTPFDVFGAEHGIHSIVRQPFRRLILGEDVRAREQQLAKCVAADELMDAVMNDSLL